MMANKIQDKEGIQKDATENNSHIFPILINPGQKKDIFETLSNDLLKYNSSGTNTKKQLINILNKNNDKKLINYSKKIFDIVYYNESINDSKVQKGMKLFQTAFLEMEGILGDIPRASGDGKTYFDHTLGVLNNILKGPNPTIEKCIIAMLHDSVEDISGYGMNHIEKVYGKKIANSVNNLTKEPLNHYVYGGNNNIELNKLEDDEGNEFINKITRKTRREHYYGNIKNRGPDEIDVKFADRLNSLETMYYYNKDKQASYINQKYLIKKMEETKKYFLISNLKDKVTDFYYNELEKKYLERYTKLNNGKIY